MLRTLHLFAGAGGGLLADLILGHTPIGAVEHDPYCCTILRERAADGWFPDLYVHEEDVRLFDPSEYAGRVDCIAAGFPCQDISVAGTGAGITGERSGLWLEVARCADILRPRYLFLENSPAITSRGLGIVLGDLARMGYDARWCVLGAAAVGAPHLRARWWCIAERTDTDVSRQQPSGRAICKPKQRDDTGWVCSNESNTDREYDDDRRYGTSEICRQRSEQAEIQEGKQMAHTKRNGLQGGKHEIRGQGPSALQRRFTDAGIKSSWWATEPNVGRVAHGVAARTHRIKALGNGQVPLQAAAAWKILGRPCGV